MAETPKPAPKPAPKLPLEERIRALETDRRAGQSVPELAHSRWARKIAVLTRRIASDLCFCSVTSNSAWIEKEVIYAFPLSSNGTDQIAPSSFPAAVGQVWAEIAARVANLEKARRWGLVKLD